MDDRALLEAAAKAAGLDLWREDVFANGLTRKVSANGIMRWNPLTDSGDALDLAVKLHIDFKAFEASVRTWVGDPVAQKVLASIEELIEGDPYAATRRAIVRAAAALAPKD